MPKKTHKPWQLVRKTTAHKKKREGTTTVKSRSDVIASTRPSPSKVARFPSTTGSSGMYNPKVYGIHEITKKMLRPSLSSVKCTIEKQLVPEFTPRIPTRKACKGCAECGRQGSEAIRQRSPYQESGPNNINTRVFLMLPYNGSETKSNESVDGTTQKRLQDTLAAKVATNQPRSCNKIVPRVHAAIAAASADSLRRVIEE